MNRKIISIFVVAMFFATALVCITPQSEAKTIDTHIEGNVGDYNYVAGNIYNATEECKINGNYTSRMMVFKNTTAEEITEAIRNGDDLTKLSGYRDPTQNLTAGNYYLVYFDNWEGSVYVGIQRPDGSSLGSVYLETMMSNPCRYKCIEIPVTEGSKVSITLDNPTDENTTALVAVVTKTLKNRIDHQSQYYTVWNKIKDNSDEVAGIFTSEYLEFTSDKVTEYYLIAFSSNEDNYGPPVHVDFNVNITGAADTSGPMAFAILFFVIAIAVVAGIVYLAKKKIIE